jgi:hypothetical protein
VRLVAVELFVNPLPTHGFVGVTREEAWPLIETLADHATQERFVYYHRWRMLRTIVYPS